MVMIMGTSTCHMVLAGDEQTVPGMCGYVEDGILPGSSGTRPASRALATTSVVRGARHAGAIRPEARERGIDLHVLLEEKAAALRVGESGLLALDWWNGNRSVLVDAGVAASHRGDACDHAREIYRALIEATAYGTRVIIETFEEHGVPIHEIVAAGGLPRKARSPCRSTPT